MFNIELFVKYSNSTKNFSKFFEAQMGFEPITIGLTVRRSNHYIATEPNSLKKVVKNFFLTTCNVYLDIVLFPRYPSLSLQVAPIIA